MAYEVQNYTGGGAATSDYPHGLWVDNTGTGGGTLINKQALSDVYQFFMRLMDSSGVSFNNSPDTTTNGFQFVQALNAQVGKFNNAWSGLMGASGLTPVILSGCVVTVPSFGHYSITAGYCWYNGKFTVINAATSVAVGSGFSPYIYITVVDGVPVGNLTAIATGTPTTSYEFPTSIFVSNPIAVFTPFTATGITFGSGFSDAGSSPNYLVSASSMGNMVNLSGQIATSVTINTGTAYNVLTLPAQFHPAAAVNFNTTHPQFGIIAFQINTSGLLQISVTVAGASGSDYIINLNNISYRLF